METRAATGAFKASAHLLDRPFDGPLVELLERSDAVIVETYPTEAYGPAAVCATSRQSAPGSLRLTTALTQNV